jgi:hypothetical protein
MLLYNTFLNNFLPNLSVRSLSNTLSFPRVSFLHEKYFHITVSSAALLKGQINDFLEFLLNFSCLLCAVTLKRGVDSTLCRMAKSRSATHSSILYFFNLQLFNAQQFNATTIPSLFWPIFEIISLGMCAHRTQGVRGTLN